MYSQLSATSGISLWGILLIVIILVGVAVRVYANRPENRPRYSGRVDSASLRDLNGPADDKGIKIAMCQIFVLDGDREGNFVRIENAIAEAKAAGAQIACLPESIVLGWENPDAHKRAQPIPGNDTVRLGKLAQKYQIYICAGLDEKDEGKLYDSAVLIDDKGEILLKHRKLEVLPELMDPPYTAAKEVNAIVDTPFGKIGLLICADTHKNEILGRMANLKPDLLLVPYGYVEIEKKWPEHGLQLQKVVKNAALRTGAPVIGTNSVGEVTKGPWAGRIYGGQSVAVDKNGDVLATAKDRDRDVVIVSIKPAR
jgi:predicted amidohydrolase